MTYEQFEYQVINMLLAGDDPRLETFKQQIWHLEVLSRYETKSGFVTAFKAPSALESRGVKSKISGMTIEAGTLGKVEIELAIENGLITSLRGTFTGTLDYSTILSHIDHLHFYYRNGRSSDLYFYDNDVPASKEGSPLSLKAEAEHMGRSTVGEHQSLAQVAVNTPKRPVTQEQMLATAPILEVPRESPPLETKPTYDPPTLPQESLSTTESPTTLGNLVNYDDQPKRVSGVPEAPGALKDDRLYKDEEKNRRMQETLEALAFDDGNDWGSPEDSPIKEKNKKIRTMIIVVCFLVGSLIGIVGMMLMLGIDIPFIN